MQVKYALRTVQFFTILGLVLFAGRISGQEKLMSPSEFLGYTMGEQFTPHYRVVEYVDHLLEAAPFLESIEYGKTAEGRPLQILVVSHQANMDKVDQFQKQHLERISGGNGTESWDDVAVAWMSYNVHGNEAVCTEAAMEVMYLTVLAAQQSENWLKKLFVLIDPCLNPDGHDRYTNWFAQYASSTPNADPVAFEHDEPWPGGRPNHYLFDLNRDWAWQKQRESQMRSEVYHDWMPHVHCDFHEMGYNSPYYFAPAAEPYHEMITDWQRAFQREIGNATAKDFDSRGELYYTRESFDLLYPSYGDTYPMFNGSIGMTYEQGGSGGAGVLVQQDSGDLLSLKQRVKNHVSSSLEAMFTSARLSTNLVDEMAEFFEQNRANPIGQFKAYCVPVNETNAQRVQELVDFLGMHQIQCEQIMRDQRIPKAWEYGTKTTRTLMANVGDLVINAHQTHSGLLQVLFDPDPVLTDSLTYDITTWSTPYAYGLQTFGLKVPVLGNEWTQNETINRIEPAYGWAVDRHGLADSRFAARAMDKGIRIRTNAEPIVYKDLKLNRGSILIIAGDQKEISGSALTEQLEELANACHVRLFPLRAGHSMEGPDMGSDDIWLLQPPRVACLSGESISSTGAGESWWHFEEELGYPISMLNNRISSPTDWTGYDVLILPSGWYRSVDDDWLDELETWIRSGGRAIAISDALNVFVNLEKWGLNRYDDDNQSNEVRKRTNDDRSADRYEPFSSRNQNRAMRTGDGSIYSVELDRSHPIAWGYSEGPYYSLRSSSKRYSAIENGWNVGTYGAQPRAISGFVGHRANRSLEGSLVFGVKPMGQGSITYLADNPLFRGFWENGKLLFDNAVFFNQY